MTNESLEHNVHSSVSIEIDQLALLTKLELNPFNDPENLPKQSALSMETPVGDQSPPILNLSPQNKSNGSSNLYDSFELRAVVKQLNRAIQGSKGPLSPTKYYLKSPLCRHHLDHIYKHNAKVPRKVTHLQKGTGDVDIKAGARGNNKLLQLWKKVKQSFKGSNC